MLLLAINSTIMLFLHELGHMITAVKEGLTPNYITFSLYFYFTPIVYVSTPGIYTLKSDKRMQIFSAGIKMNLFLYSFFIMLVNLTKQEIFFLFALPNLFRVVTNLSPFMPLDGYLMLTTILKKPNIRKNSFDLLKSFGKEKKKVQLPIIIYTLISIIFIGFLLITQTLTFINNFKIAYNFGNTNFIKFIYQMRAYSILIIIILIKQLITSKELPRRLSIVSCRRSSTPVRIFSSCA